MKKIIKKTWFGIIISYPIFYLLPDSVNDFGFSCAIACMVDVYKKK